jgi:2-polyprenyl-3-methyl-5-hydroxy-6-metoxy-1,4-benzoquinol methylase
VAEAVPAPRGFDYAAAAKESVPCPLCGQASFERLATIDRYGMGLATVGCHGCGLVQTQPRLTMNGFADFYRQSYRAYYQGVVEPSADYVRQMNKAVRLDATVAWLRDAGVLDGAAAVLDVGCSEGTLFTALRRGGFAGALRGIEPNDAFRAYTVAEHGAEVVASEGELPAAWRGTIGVVTLIHVLEHVADPVATLAHLRTFLGAGGHLYVDVPDIAEYGSVNDLHIAHVFHFGTRTLRATLVAAGFEVASIESHRPPGHPPSLRALARPAGHPSEAAGVTRPADGSSAAAALALANPPGSGSEPAGWEEVRRINRARHRLALKRLIRSTLARSPIYTALRARRRR